MDILVAPKEVNIFRQDLIELPELMGPLPDLESA
jgi:hypothetical protein